MPGENRIRFEQHEFEKNEHPQDYPTPDTWKAIMRCGCAIECDKKGVIRLTRVGNRCPSNENGHKLSKATRKKKE